MKAMIFAAGLGTRLRPITDNMPKALVEVGGKPMLRHVFDALISAGIDEVVVNVHHFADMIEDYLRTNDNFGITVHVSDERSLLLDTGGGILAARKWLDGGEPFVAYNADILSDFSVGEMIRHHNDTGADVSLLVSDRSSSRYLLFVDGCRMRGWKNIKTGEVKPSNLACDTLAPMAFGGVHVISPKIFPLLEDYAANGRAFSITPFYVSVCHRLNIMGYKPDDAYRWVDIGKPESLERARRLLE